MTISRDALAAELAATHDLDETAAAESVALYAEQLDAPDGDLTNTDADHIRRALQAALAHDTGAPVDAVYEATAELARLRNDVALAEQDWRAAIRAALADGQRVVDIAEAAGISRERVYQIRDGRR
ncbi:MAG TPA: hypothetical protein VFH56_02230 [Acidimicrobiales bacterium]|nr:hypothetical protein [Acidimicrobiales bacterium]